MKNLTVLAVSLVLSILAFVLFYFAWIYSLSPITSFSLFASGMLFAIATLFKMGVIIGEAYLHHPENARDFSFEIVKRKRLFWIVFVLAAAFIVIAFATSQTALFSLLGYVMSL